VLRKKTSCASRGPAAGTGRALRPASTVRSRRGCSGPSSPTSGSGAVTSTNALAALEADAAESGGDFKLVRGLAALIERECVFETRAPVPPQRVRRAAFEAAEAVGVASETERETAIDRAADALGIEPGTWRRRCTPTATSTRSSSTPTCGGTRTPSSNSTTSRSHRPRCSTPPRSGSDRTTRNGSSRRRSSGSG